MLTREDHNLRSEREKAYGQLFLVVQPAACLLVFVLEAVVLVPKVVAVVVVVEVAAVVVGIVASRL